MFQWDNDSILNDVLLRSFLCMYYFVSDYILHACVLCSIVTGEVDLVGLKPDP